MSVIMRTTVVLTCVLGLLVAEGGARYHRQVGIPTAASIRMQETMRIAGGISSYVGEHPFLAGLIVTMKTGETSVCGGAVLSYYYVVTIGQCWDDGEYQGEDIQVVLGSAKLFFGGKRVYASSVSLHPKYDPNTLANDIAMIRIPYISFNSYINKIILPEAYSSSYAGFKAQIIGYGKTAPDAELDGTASLRDVYVQVIDNTVCNKLYGSVVTNDVMCTSGDNGKGACGGDYGGPLILRRYVGASGQDVLIGLVSFTSSAGCDAGHPTGYTRITSYLKWINNFL